METVNEMINRGDLSQEEKAEKIIDWVLHSVRGQADYSGEHKGYVVIECLDVLNSDLKRAVR